MDLTRKFEIGATVALAIPAEQVLDVFSIRPDALLVAVIAVDEH
jgi:hypothetical protein